MSVGKVTSERENRKETRREQKSRKYPWKKTNFRREKLLVTHKDPSRVFC